MNAQSNLKQIISPKDPDGGETEVLSSQQRRRKDMFGDCALVEIIHLHDCLRGAVRELQQDVTALSQSVLQGKGQQVAELERRVAGRFKVIWSVFRAHSAAEDEFIWPALRNKTGATGRSSPHSDEDEAQPAGINMDDHNHHHAQAVPPDDASPSIIEQEEYEEDHADEERMFRNMDALLSKLRRSLRQEHDRLVSKANEITDTAPKESVHDTAKAIHEQTRSLSQHLMTHLEKEETQCMPLVVKHLTKTEINDLVGQIMGKRSSDTIAQIMTMAVQNLNEKDRDEMVRYMKQAMVGTFFERWLSMSGWMASARKGSLSEGSAGEKEDEPRVHLEGKLASPSASSKRVHDGEESLEGQADKKPRAMEPSQEALNECPLGNSVSTCANCQYAGMCSVAAAQRSSSTVEVTSQTELEKFIRAIAANSELTAAQKNATIQGLRDSVWKSNLRTKSTTMDSSEMGQTHMLRMPMNATASDSRVASAAGTRSRRMTPASSYYKKDRDDNIVLVWSSDSDGTKFPPPDVAVPLFSASELAPTFHDGANGAVLGCPHYARACKLRHPSSGRLYTCRLCCEQEREMPMKDRDAPLDRYAVTEVLCMRCGALQPANDRCVNPKCESRGRPYAKYSCNICNLYDDGPNKNIYHCPFCNVCRSGLGLGIDYRHCMRCNACVSLADDKHHCIPQRLQGSCPICHESMFESTEPLRGLQCGHVMHLSCFSMYMRGHSYTCPLCKKSVEDMKEYFSQLDAAVRMQPMPAAYLSTMSNIYCQDCGQTGQVQYHFVGCKCSHCGSYNTRELGRVQVNNSPT